MFYEFDICFYFFAEVGNDFLKKTICDSVTDSNETLDMAIGNYHVQSSEN